jgi:hypothetical protein
MEKTQKQQACTRECKDSKKPYVKPDVTKHGNVESLTQTPVAGPSCPVIFND